MGKGVKFGAIGLVCVGLAALIAAPIARHRQGTADAQTAPAHGIDPNIVPPLTIGMNTGALGMIATETPFSDPIRTFGVLSWEKEPSRGPLTDQMKRDSAGNPIDAPADAWLSARVHDGSSPNVPGTYHCTVSPGWKIGNFIGGQVFQTGTRFTFDVGKADNVSVFNIMAEKPGVSLTHLACQYPGASANEGMFRRAFLEDMRPFRVIRFMDWMVANNAPMRTWATRTTPESIDQSTNGVALEYMVALANQLHSDPWFTLPLDTDKDYYRNFATYVRDHLDPDLKAYVELSNEVWNDSFKQSKDATERGKALYPGVSDDKANDYYYADRVRDLMGIWDDVYKGQTKRIVRVLASQMWSQRTEQRLGHKDTWKYVDAVAIAPYFGGPPFDVKTTGKARVEAVIANTPGYINGALKDGHENKVVAARYGLPLITYEGGPGYWGFDPETEKDMREVSHDPRLYALYQNFLRRWQKEIGGLLVLFEGTGSGLFGHKDYTGQPLSEAVKMRAVVDFIHSLPPDQQPRGETKPAS